jgi:hypothetical protein
VNRIGCGLLKRPHPQTYALLLADTWNSRRVANNPSAARRGWPLEFAGEAPAVSGNGIRRTGTRLFLLLEPLDRGSLRLGCRPKLEGAFTLVAGTLRSCCPFAAGYDTGINSGSNLPGRQGAKIMCCGNNRAVFSQTRVSAPTGRAAKTPPAFATRQRSNVAYFEYTGKTAITVRGPMSGTTYRFAAPGARVIVDLRDGQHLEAVPNLVRVRSL